VVPTDEVLYGLFAADSPGIVLQACQRAGIPTERLSAGVHARMTLEPCATGWPGRDNARETPDSSIAAGNNTYRGQHTDRP
jgi:hypothetical protein